MKDTFTKLLGITGLLFVLVFAGCKTPNIKFGPGGDEGAYRGEIENELVIAEPVGVSPTEPTLPPARIDIEATQQPKKKGIFGFLGKKGKKEPEAVAEGPASPAGPTGPVVTEEPVVPKTEAELGSIDGGVEYKLQVGDSVVVKIGPPINTDVADKLNGKGHINLPIIGDISAVGLTVTELEELIKNTYVQKQITKEPPHITVATDIKFYYIQGEVRSGGGRYPLLPPMTLSKSVAAANGFTEWAKKKKIRVYRGNKILTVNYEMIEDDPRADVEIKANDLIVVDKTGLFLNN